MQKKVGGARLALVGCGAAAVLVPVALGLAAWGLGGRAKSLVEAELAESVDATVSFGDVDVSAFSSFPRLAVRVHDLKVVGKGAFDGVELASIGEAAVAVDAMSLVGGGPMKVREVRLVDPHVHVVVDPEGRANYDIAKGASDASTPEPQPASSSGFALDLDHLDVANLELVYDDQKGGTFAEIHDLDHQSSGSVSSDLLRMKTHTQVASLTARAAGITYVKQAKLDADVAVDLDQTSGKVTFGENKIALNDLVVGFQGSVQPKGEDVDVDVAVKTLDTSFKTLLSLVPDAYTASFQDVKTTGTLGLDLTAKGTYQKKGDHLPAFDMTLRVGEGSFQYPDLPAAIDDIAIDFQLHHPEGEKDLTEVDIKTLKFAPAGAPFEGRIHVEHPVTDPDIDASLHGRLNLDDVRKAMPIAAEYSGTVDFDMDIAGRQSAFESQDFDHVKANGTFKMQGFHYATDDLPVAFDIHALDCTLSPQTARLDALALKFGRSDLEAKGSITNFIPYALGNGTLGGDIELTSHLLDAKPFQGSSKDEKGKTADASEDSGPLLVAVPTNLDLRVHAHADEVETKQVKLKGVDGTLLVKDGGVHLDPLKMGVLGGQVTISGDYVAPTVKSADVDLAITAAKLDIGDTMSTFTTAAVLVPVAKNAKGKFDSGFQMKTKLAADGTPDTQLLFSKGSFRTYGLSLAPDMLDKVAKALGDGKKYSSMSLDGANLAYVLEHGKATMSPFDVKLGGVPTKVHGSADVLAKKIDLAMDVKVPTQAVKSMLGDKVGKLGKDADVTVHVAGPWDDPKVTVALAGEVVDAAIDDLVAAAQKAGDELIAAAEKLKDQLIAQAKKTGDAGKAKAKDQGDKLMKEAKGNPVKTQAAKVAVKKLDDAADKAADKLVQEAGKKGDQGIAEAKKKKDQLIADAEKKMKAQAGK